MVRTVCLNEDKHATTMLRGLKQMKHEDIFCDFTIKILDFEYHVHRNVIAVASPYFKAMLKHDTIESREQKVTMKDVDTECVKSCIDFMYSGKFDFPEGKTRKLLHVAIMMQLEDVKEAICNILTEELNAENFYETKSIADAFELSPLTLQCETYYQENLLAISAQPGFENENKSHVMDILPNLSLNEDDQLVVALRWVGDDCDRIEEFVEFIKVIDLNRVSLKCLSDLLQNYPFVKNDFHLYGKLSAPLIEYVGTNADEGVRNCDSLSINENLIIFDQTANCLRSYNSTTNEVTKFRDKGFTNFLPFTAISLNSYIYLLCRQRRSYRLSLLDNNSYWEKIPDQIDDHGTYPACATLAGSLFMIGFGDTSQSTRDVEVFNPVVNHWLKLPNKPTKISLTALVNLDDSIYCIGGWAGGQTVRSFCKFTPSASEWVDLTPMKKPRRSCGAVAFSKKIYIVGGKRDDSDKMQDVECYDVKTQQWTSLSPTLGSFGFNVAHHIDDWIFAIPRSSRTVEYSDEIEKYDVVNDNWSRVILIGVENRFAIQFALQIS